MGQNSWHVIKIIVNNHSINYYVFLFLIDKKYYELNFYTKGPVKSQIGLYLNYSDTCNKLPVLINDYNSFHKKITPILQKFIDAFPKDNSDKTK